MAFSGVRKLVTHVGQKVGFRAVGLVGFFFGLLNLRHGVAELVRHFIKGDGEIANLVVAIDRECGI